MNWSYIAGFFDGEGSFSIKNGCVRISIPQTNEEVLNNIRNFVEAGNICKVSKRKSHWKDCWLYYITNQKDVYRFLMNIKGKIIVKKEAIEKNLPAIKEKIIENKKNKTYRFKRLSTLIKLRNKGLSYRDIGKCTGLDCGHIRRIVLGLP